MSEDPEKLLLAAVAPKIPAAPVRGDKLPAPVPNCCAIPGYICCMPFMPEACCCMSSGGIFGAACCMSDARCAEARIC